MGSHDGNPIILQSGDKYGKLTIVGFAGRKDGNGYHYVQCECGSQIKKVMTTLIINGRVQSCGCLSGMVFKNRTYKPKKFKTYQRNYVVKDTEMYCSTCDAMIHKSDPHVVVFKPVDTLYFCKRHVKDAEQFMEYHWEFVGM